ncbi:malate:quinone oxidoreductase, partial [Gordonia sp. HY442]|uniref:malate:quinone oxidoreductase n=1 Tax=Gordonia zhenghanii TaxID=2911516 RepID=UPI001F032298
MRKVSDRLASLAGVSTLRLAPLAQDGAPLDQRRAEEADVVLIGGGIMSATLGSMLAVSDPALKIVVLERFDEVAAESSGPWNNAGTGHSGFCELNYMPDPTDGAKPAEIA